MREVTAFDLAQRFVGVREVSGALDSPQILAMLRLDATWPEHDEVPWCSAFVNYVAWLLRLPRSKSLAARSWLGIGQSVSVDDARVGYDVVILKRGTNPAQGHVGFYAGRGEFDPTHGPTVMVLGGNQGDSVSVLGFLETSVLGVRRLA